MRILGVVNQKGGCGKTTTAINLASWLAERGRKVLLVDVDPQGHATSGLNAQDLSPEVDLRRALLNLYEEPFALSQLAVPMADGLSLVPSLLSLVALEQELANAADKDRRLRDLIARGGSAYDYILIDSPPNLGILTVNVLTASREILTPVDTGMFSLHGLRRLFQVIELVRDRLGLKPVVRILLTMYDRRLRLSKTVLGRVEEQYPGCLLETKIRMSVHLKEAPSFGLPILRHRPNSLGCWDYEALAEEILSLEEEMAALEAAGAFQESRPVRDAEEARPEAEEMFREVTFHIPAPQARSVALVGEFNRWQHEKALRLERGEDGVWRGRLSVPPGSYQYKYLVDGQWVLDPENPLRVVTDNGIVNSLIRVK